MSALLEVDAVRAGYGSVMIVHDVSLHIERGELVTIIGPNGAGKSTLLKAIFGLLPVSEGQVRLEGSEVTDEMPSRMVGLGVSFVPQTENVFPSLTIRENLEMAATSAATASPRVSPRCCGSSPSWPSARPHAPRTSRAGSARRSRSRAR